MPKNKHLGLQLVLAVSIFFFGSASANNETPRRIISLAPHLTEAVFWLGAGDSLKGRDRFSNYPAAALNVPVVGDAYSLNIEALLALKPDLLLLWQAPSFLRQQLNKLGLKTFNSKPQTPQQVLTELQRLAGVLGLKADSRFQVLEQQLAHLQQQKRSQLTVAKPSALLLVQNQPPIVLGMGDPLAASLGFCGWKNAVASPAAVVNLNPEYLLTGDYQAILAFDTVADRYFKSVPVIRPPADVLVRPGPRFLGALTQLCEQLNKAR